MAATLFFEQFFAFGMVEEMDEEGVMAAKKITIGVCVMEKKVKCGYEAEVVRLRSHHDKYLLADVDKVGVYQDRNGTYNNAKWTVEIVAGANLIRLKSCYDKYLTASNVQFLLGTTGKKVLQTLPTRLNSSLAWEPIREGAKVRLRTRYGRFLRANKGLPPWRNSITHDIRQQKSTSNWVLWDVDLVQLRLTPPAPILTLNPADAAMLESPPYADDASFSFHRRSPDLSTQELKEKLKEETGYDDIVVCSRNPLYPKLYPLISIAS
ncbi:unnamed protein product [Sphenostylis stenocarpa]|uniref:DUF569 domain-containing protein n=1 Tax=Sphenostylis stenocarpa TaxID=92480 RepID=A0AA86SAP4_9FABA|nr:unnamed protein product [Sphenostylis stenocarpa]